MNFISLIGALQVVAAPSAISAREALELSPQEVADRILPSGHKDIKFVFRPIGTRAITNLTRLTLISSAESLPNGGCIADQYDVELSPAEKDAALLPSNIPMKASSVKSSHLYKFYDWRTLHRGKPCNNNDVQNYFGYSGSIDLWRALNISKMILARYGKRICVSSRDVDSKCAGGYYLDLNPSNISYIAINNLEMGNAYEFKIQFSDKGERHVIGKEIYASIMLNGKNVELLSPVKAKTVTTWM